MTIQHQTYSPSTCNCVIEQQFDDAEPVETRQVTLYFFHKICPLHEPLVANKPQLSQGQLKQKREAIIKHHESLLKDNRAKHMKDHDDARKKTRSAIAELKTSNVTEKHALSIEAKLDNERLQTEQFLDRHEVDSMDFLVSGLFSSPHSLDAQQVYDKVMQEQREANPIIDNDG